MGEQRLETGRSRGRLSVMAARVSIAAVTTYHVLLFTLIFLRPDLDPSWHTISEWVTGPYGWLMVMAFIVSAVSYGSLFAAIRLEVRGLSGKIGAGMLFICAIGTFGVGVFVTDPMPLRPPLSISGTIHTITGGLAMMLLPFAALLINRSIALKNEKFTAARRILLLTSGLPLLALIGMIVHLAFFVIPLGPEAYGPGVHIGWPPRILFLMYGVWVIIVAWQVIKRKSAV